MSLTELQHMFPPPMWPQIMALQSDDGKAVLTLDIAPDLHWFTGHFPDQPVLAGVVQTHWAAEFSKALFPLGDIFQGLDNLKFQQAVLPDQTVRLTLEYSPVAGLVRFAYHRGQNLCSEGRLAFQQQDQ